MCCYHTNVWRLVAESDKRVQILMIHISHLLQTWHNNCFKTLLILTKDRILPYPLWGSGVPNNVHCLILSNGIAKGTGENWPVQFKFNDYLYYQRNVFTNIDSRILNIKSVIYFYISFPTFRHVRYENCGLVATRSQSRTERIPNVPKT